jgi:glycosyltransferase involved in cell wall biosynthesis
MATDLGVNEWTQIGSIPPGNREGMATIMSKASLVTLLSEYEAHPIAVMEALSLRRPVLVADTSGLSELAQGGFVSAIPLNSTTTQIAEAVLEQLCSPRQPSAIALPTWDECANTLLALYDDIIEESRCES